MFNVSRSIAGLFGRVWLLILVSFVAAGCGRTESMPESVRQSSLAQAASRPEVTPKVSTSPIVTAARAQVGVTVTYDSGYVGLSYPNGDLPREKGVCTDVVIRALRDARDMDLQRLVHEDMKKAFSAYPKIWGLKRPDRNIDHRRVPNLMTYFKRRGCSVAVTRAAADYLPGDLVTCTVGRNRPHIMIVSDRKDRDGDPMVIHNIGRGTQEESGLFRFPITGHYRVKVPASIVSRRPASASAVRATASGSSATAKTIHVFVALCDNENQGIVPVPASLGNGEDPKNNLYWGAMYGTKSFLKRSGSWMYLGEKDAATIHGMKRIVFKHATKNAYLVADAYRGRSIKQTVMDFLRAAGGNDGGALKIDDAMLGLNGNASLVVYVGHNGLMDVDVEKQKRAPLGRAVSSMVLACKSEPYFRSRLEALGSTPVLLTTGFMAPEAYTLDAAVCAWLSDDSGEMIREQAAVAYNKYQKCGMNGARNLFWNSTESQAR